MEHSARVARVEVVGTRDEARFGVLKQALAFNLVFDRFIDPE